MFDGTNFTLIIFESERKITPYWKQMEENVTLFISKTKVKNSQKRPDSNHHQYITWVFETYSGQRASKTWRKIITMNTIFKHYT